MAGQPKAGQLSGVAAAASTNRQQQSKGFCYRCGDNHRVRECPEECKVPVNKGQRRAGCFWCGSAKHFVRNCPQPAPQLGAAEEVGFRVEGADRGLRVFCHRDRVSRAYRGHLSSAEDVLLSGACALKDRLDLSRAAGIKLTSRRMPVVQGILNGRCFFVW